MADIYLAYRPHYGSITVLCSRIHPFLPFIPPTVCVRIAVVFPDVSGFVRRLNRLTSETDFISRTLRYCQTERRDGTEGQERLCEKDY